MSIRVMAQVWDIDLPDSEKLIALALADWANDEGECWPSIAQISKKCSKSERTVQMALAALEKKGQLTRNQIPGRGCKYVIHPRNDCTPAKSARAQGTTQTPAAVAPNTSVTTNTSEAKASSVARERVSPSRGSKLPEDWEPKLTDRARSIVDGWPPGRFERELRRFRDHAADKGRISKDWQAAFRTWIEKADDFGPPRQQNSPTPGIGRNGAGAIRDPVLAHFANASRLG